ncbi:MAG TPA: MBL fold metallo-hydrolase [Bacillota bacterium]|jgi:cyclase|nr:MBL fold metallo-hydrolase [Bacillota bacterium]HPZ21814.1 MBL fold metallo-hydrolase [Bacillota bacterium]HQD19408.1 MBL fold metallo-hydrolase [Bacillota bacterium]
MKNLLVLGERVNASVVTLEEGTIVIDTSVDEEGADAVHAAAGERGSVLYVVNTHEHDDHLAGNRLFTCPAISSAAARQQMVEASVAALPDLVFSHELELFLSQRVFLKHYGGHSPGSAVVFFPQEGLLFTGDLVFNGRVPYMGEADFHRWLAALTELEGWDASTVVPGHGPKGGKELLTRQRQWLEQYIEDVLNWTAQGLSFQEMLQQVLMRHQVVERWHPMLLRSFELILKEYN